MKKIYLALLTAFLSSILFNNANAQNLQNDFVKKLITQNESSLNITNDDLDNSIITSAYYDKTSKLNLVYLQQSYQGISVYNMIQVMAFKNDKLVSNTGGRIYRIQDLVINQKAITPVSAKEAVTLAAKAVNLNAETLKLSALSILRTTPDNQKVEFTPTSATRVSITSEKMWVQDSTGKVHLAWQVRLVPAATPDYWLIRVNAQDGNILGKDNLTVYDWFGPKENLKINGSGFLNQGFKTGKTIQVLNAENDIDKKPILFSASEKKSQFTVNSATYRVIPYPEESMSTPGVVPTLTTNPWTLAGAGNNATSLNWHNDGTTEYNITRGNNVWAKEDTAGNNGNGASAISSTPLPNLTFDFALNSAIAPDSPTNLNLGITNLFYWNNIIHDLSYQYGFDEPSGNFQNNNLGRGGIGNDFVLTDAQDGSGRNNANFSTPTDGNSPRMQMFLWDGYPYGKLKINSPAQYAGTVTSIEGAFSTANQIRDVGPVTGDLALYKDNATGTINLGCAAAANPTELNGKIAILYRGSCNFVTKVKNAQNAGSIGVIVVDSVPNEIITMGGTDNTITIPAVMIMLGDGNTIVAAMATQTFNATFKAAIDLDGDLDNGIIAHEYTHGISNRLTGGPTQVTCLQNNEQMGEGWSDYVALMAITDWSKAAVSDGTKPRSIGTYVLSESSTGGGIRRYPYTTDMSINPYTYGNVASSGGEPHAIGEIWTTVLWDMTWNIIQQSGVINQNLFNANGTGGNSDAMKLVFLGMKLQPCSPGFLDGRDAILKADDILFGGKYHCAIWDAFARRGMGVNASEGSAMSATDQIENFDVPSGATVHKSVDLPLSAQNGILTYTFTVQSQCQPISGFKVVDTLANNVTYLEGGTYNSGNRTVTFTVPDLTASQTTTFTLKVKVNSGTFFPSSVLFSEPVSTNPVPSTFVNTSNVPSKKWGTSTLYNSSPYSLKSASASTPTEQVLTLATPINITGHVQLSFYQMLSTEPGKDGGVVELSLDGNNWFDAGPYMASNGYNSIIHTNSNLNNKPAFSGSITAFFQTVINLSAFQNQNVFFRFRYVTDSIGNSLGWYIDDILVQKSPAVYNLAKIMDNTNTTYGLSDTITAITSAVLPVTWSYFSVQKKESSAQLHWSTATEINTYKFFVERSTDGIHFVNLASVDAAGNSNLPNDYSFTDQAPASGNNFYRVKLVDKDGKINYSEIKSLFFADVLRRTVLLSPNPGMSNVELLVTGNQSLLKVKILDAAGRLLKVLDMNSDRIALPVSNLAEGMYYIQISGQNLNVMKKFIKGR